ncbi:hypothetical protein LguiB_036333 [Lonicera macranthoides]
MMQIPAWVALIVNLASEGLKETILSEQKAVKESSYSVSGILSSFNLVSTSRSENLQELLDGNKRTFFYEPDGINQKVKREEEP